MHSRTGNRKFLHRSIGAALFALCALAAHAQTTVYDLYWDTNGSKSGAGTGSAQWSGANWSTNSEGTGSTTSWSDYAWWSPPANTVFSAGSNLTGNYTVTVGSDITTRSITIDDGSPIFSVNSGVTLNLGNAPADWSLDSSVLALGSKTLTIAGAGTTNLTANLTGTGALIKDGTSTLQIYGHDKSFTGTTRVNNGTVILDTLDGENGAIKGILYIGDGTGSANTAIVQNGPAPYADEMISNSSAVTIRSDGLLNLNNQTETIGSLTFNNGGHASTGGNSGQLIVGSNGSGTVTSTGTATIDGGGVLTVTKFAVTSGELNVSTNLGAGPINNLNLNTTKTGDGTLVLSGANTYSNSITYVNAGVLVAANSAALGDSSNTVVVDTGASLHLSGNISLTTKEIRISGNGANGEGALFNKSGINTYTGDLITSESTSNTIGTANGSTLNITPNNLVTKTALTIATQGTGIINITSSASLGGEIIKTGTGTLIFGGNSSANLQKQFSIKEGLVLLNKTGGNRLEGGTNIVIGDSYGAAGTAILRLNQDEQIGQNYPTIKVNADGIFDLNGHREAFDLQNTIELNGGELQLAGGELDVDILKITANSVIDFGTPTGDANSTLWVKNLIIAAGVTVTVKNWNSVTDFFYADNINSTDGGTWLSTNPLNISPMNQIVFEGWDGSQTIWASNETNGYSGRTYNRIRPVPEPSTYGAILSLASIAALFWLRRGKA